MMKMLIDSHITLLIFKSNTFIVSCISPVIRFCSRTSFINHGRETLDENPNMIDKLMYEVNSPSSGSSSSSTNKTAESSQQLCDAPTDITLHQSWLQLPSNTNKRKAKAPVTPENEDRIQKPAAPTNPEHQKLVVSDQENIESNSKSDDGENLHDPEQVARDLTLYKIKKKLTMSDLGNLSRLLVPGYMIKNFVLPLVDADFKQRVESKAGKQVTVKDSDKETEHQLTFRYLKSSKSYVFNGKWKEFVKRRDLKKDDEIGLYWQWRSQKTKLGGSEFNINYTKQK